MSKRNAMALWAAFAILLAACTGANPAGSASPAGSDGPSTSGEPAGSAGAADLTIESWRTDDLAIWQDEIIPAFNAKYPDITVTFAPTKPDEYNGVLNTKLQGGTAGDLITCRPFDASLQLFKDGNLAALNDLPGLANFGDVAKSAWITDDGKDVFCVPMASVIHGFIYNQEAFDKLSVTAAPTTVEEFHALLDKFKTDGTYTPLAMGTKELWESATMGFQNIGPNYWKGEEGRKALIDGSAKFTDQPYVDTWAELASWKPYLPNGYEAIAYADAQQYFASGNAAV
jgi:raffinose/stachyose/melibiose transport system substrate-binding protein